MEGFAVEVFATSWIEIIKIGGKGDSVKGRGLAILVIEIHKPCGCTWERLSEVLCDLVD